MRLLSGPYHQRVIASAAAMLPPGLQQMKRNGMEAEHARRCCSSHSSHSCLLQQQPSSTPVSSLQPWFKDCIKRARTRGGGGSGEKPSIGLQGIQRQLMFLRDMAVLLHTEAGVSSAYVDGHKWSSASALSSETKLMSELIEDTRNAAFDVLLAETDDKHQGRGEPSDARGCSAASWAKLITEDVSFFELLPQPFQHSGEIGEEDRGGFLLCSLCLEFLLPPEYVADPDDTLATRGTAAADTSLMSRVLLAILALHYATSAAVNYKLPVPNQVQRRFGAEKRLGGAQPKAQATADVVWNDKKSALSFPPSSLMTPRMHQVTQELFERISFWLSDVLTMQLAGGFATRMLGIGVPWVVLNGPVALPPADTQNALRSSRVITPQVTDVIRLIHRDELCRQFINRMEAFRYSSSAATATNAPSPTCATVRAPFVDSFALSRSEEELKEINRALSSTAQH